MKSSSILKLILASLLLWSCSMEATQDEADQLFTEGEFKAAAVKYDKVIALEPDNSFAIYNRGLAREKIEDYENASDDFTYLIKHKKYTRLAYLGRARCSFEQQIYKSVVMDMNQLILRDENDIDALLLRGKANVKLYKNNKALDDLDKVVDAQPKNIDALITRGAALARGGQGAYAIQDFDRAMKIDPSLPVIYFNKGVVFFTYENWGAAMENFEKALELDPNYVEAITRIGMTKLNWSKHSKAEACVDFKKAQKMNDELATEYVKEFCSN